MSLADARCTVLQVPGLQVAGAISGASVNADVAAARIVNMGPAPGGSPTLQSALVPGLTAGSVLFVQQKSSGAAVTPVVATTTAVVGGFAVLLTAAANIPVDADYWVYVAEF